VKYIDIIAIKKKLRRR